MPMAPFSETYSKGTHFSDGVRVGPLYPTTYTPNPAVGGNFLTPIFVETPPDQLRCPGVLLGPEVIYSITPYQAQNDAFSPSSGQNLTAAGLFTLGNFYKPNSSQSLGSNPGGVSLVPLQTPIVSGASDPNGRQTFTQALVLDVPRCVSVTSNNVLQSNGITLTAYGIDQYGFYVYSTISVTSMVALSSLVFPKAMRALLGIYCSGAMTVGSTFTFGTSDVYGLPYRINNPSSLFPIWGGVPLYAVSNGNLSGFQTLDNTSPIGKQLNALLPLGPAFSCVMAGNPPSYSVTNPTPIATARTGDVRGLICIPGYERVNTNDGTGAPQSTYTSSIAIGAGRNLNVRLYVPGALATKPGLTNVNQGFSNLQSLPLTLMTFAQAQNAQTLTITGWGATGILTETLTLSTSATTNSVNSYYSLISVVNGSTASNNTFTITGATGGFVFAPLQTLGENATALLSSLPVNAPGYPVLVPPYSGAPACIPLDVPTLPVDLYGSPQYWPV